MLTLIAALVVAAGSVAIGPVLDPLDGARVTDKERGILPSGRSVAGVADLWFLELTDMRFGGGGIEMLDPTALSSHGRSATQMQYLLNGLEVTDPAQPGTPLVTLPHDFWQALSYTSLWTSTPGLAWTALPPTSDATQTSARVGGGAPTGGGTWIPAGLMDREPATPFGATAQRRKLDRTWEVGAHTEAQRMALSVEQLSQTHAYPTLRASNGRLIDDDGRRSTALLTLASDVGVLPVTFLALYQESARDHAGAQDRLPLPLTLDQTARAFVAQAQTELTVSSTLAIDARVGLGLRDARSRLYGDAPIVSDLEDEWTWLHRPRFGDRARSGRLDAALDARLGKGDATHATLTLGYAWLRSQAEIPAGITGVSYNRASTAAERSVSMTVYDPVEAAHEALGRARVDIEHHVTWAQIDWRLAAGLDYGAVYAAQRQQLASLSPAVGLAATYAVGRHELFLIVRHEPERLTAEVSEFLDADRPSGRIYGWNDDGDGLPETGEQGALLARTGGAAHRAAADLRRPTSEHIALGVRSLRFGPFRAVVSGVGRLLRDRYTVRLSERAAASYERVKVADIAAEERTNGRLFASDLSLPIWARTPGTEGDEVYELVNASRTSVYAGAELELVTVERGHWFVDFGASGYFSLGTTPFGIFADRNDGGIIDETSADPNHRINSWGSVDSGRAFGLKLLAGMEPLERLWTSVAIRYRDGEPMSRIVVIEDLPQGATAVMADSRGNPVPRFTFHMTLDARLRYTMTLSPVELAFVLDGYNLLGSGTEITEDLRTGPKWSAGGPWRSSLEMMPGRALFASLEGRWQ
ncbi:MAG: hypothetical protein AAB426_09460 [Myxococcota bacterium]